MAFNKEDSMANFVQQATDFQGKIMILICLSAIMGLGKGGVPGFATVATALVVATAPRDVQGGLGYSVALMVPILTMIDVYAAWLHRKCLDWSSIWQLLPLSFVGMFLGQKLDQYLSDRSARIIVGSILLSILILRIKDMIPSSLASKVPSVFGKKEKVEGSLPLMRHETPTGSNPSQQGSTLVWACIVGLFGGAATMLTNSMGPILNVYLLSVRKLPPESYIGSRAMFFCFLNVGKLPMRFVGGTLGWPMMPLAFGLGLVAIIGVYCAKPIMLSMSPDTFTKLELLVVVLCGFKLLLF
ncbi:unnamed protein product [Cylindrotheca closterium]|uniref:Membrane transporter protein n=1 Tax=Cylindrotheca closterium TaxID=2856 RepID=A0AAD2FFN9_9STRA|nr:unnamed protein product [Cylindrotheca closterium]